ncbi:hypothetical protein N0V82_005932 [Gnomoniopsis sp. IMI 355080]|nr:hypothetical protein N0V82_005932 [Gnomoniopsis sp. IMI 355080]
MAKFKPVFYAVAKGRRPGIYKKWLDCSAQVTGFSGSRFKGHQSLEEAKLWMQEHDAELYAVVVGHSSPSVSTFVPRPVPIASTLAAVAADKPTSTVACSQGFRSTWRPYDELSREVKLQLTQEAQAIQGCDVKPKDVKHLYERRRTTAMHYELYTRFFKDSASTLEGYQKLCRAVRIEASDTIQGCRDDLRGTLINIVDLLEALELNEPVKVWPHEHWNAFTKYTRKPENCFHLGTARKSDYLQCFLQELSREEPRRFGNPRPLETLVNPDLLMPAPTSPRPSAKVKQESKYEGIGRLSPLASECTYEHDDQAPMTSNKSRKRSFGNLEDEEVGRGLGNKRSRFNSARKVNALRFSQGASEATSFEDLEEVVPSGQGYDPA